jgi:hypothetical protein
MDVTGVQQAIFLSWFEHAGKLILLSFAQMQLLILAAKEFATALGGLHQGALAESLEVAFTNVVGATSAKKKPPKNMTIAEIKKELKETYLYTNIDLKLGHTQD